MCYDVQAVHINNGLGEYSRNSEDAAREFAPKIGIPLKVYNIENLLGFPFQETVKYSLRKICVVCSEVQRYYLNRLALQLGCDVIVTGDTLDDETSLLIGSILNWQMDRNSAIGPISSEEKGMVRKTKPLVRLTDREVHMYAVLNDIHSNEDKCLHAKGSARPIYKKVLEAIEWEMPGTREYFYSAYLKKAKYQMARAEVRKGSAYHCPCCGYKTVQKDLCFMCKLKERVARG